MLLPSGKHFQRRPVTARCGRWQPEIGTQVIRQVLRRCRPIVAGDAGQLPPRRQDGKNGAGQRDNGAPLPHYRDEMMSALPRPGMLDQVTNRVGHIVFRTRLARRLPTIEGRRTGLRRSKEDGGRRWSDQADYFRAGAWETGQARCRLRRTATHIDASRSRVMSSPHGWHCGSRADRAARVRCQAESAAGCRRQVGCGQAATERLALSRKDDSARGGHALANA